MLGVLLGVIDRYVPKAVARDGNQALTAFSLEAGDVRIDGTDQARINAAGLIDYLSVCWRPLPEVVTMQNRLAPVLGIPPLSLVESPGMDG